MRHLCFTVRLSSHEQYFGLYKKMLRYKLVIFIFLLLKHEQPKFQITVTLTIFLLKYLSYHTTKIYLVWKQPKSVKVVPAHLATFTFGIFNLKMNDYSVLWNEKCFVIMRGRWYLWFGSKYCLFIPLNSAF